MRRDAGLAVVLAALIASPARAQDATPARRLAARCAEIVAELEVQSGERYLPYVVYNRCAQCFFACWAFPLNATSAQQARAAADEVAARFAGELLRKSQELAAAAGASAILPDHVVSASAELLPCEIDADGSATFFPALAPAERVWIYSADLAAYETTLKGFGALKTAAGEAELEAELRRELAEAALRAAAATLARHGILVHRMAGELARKQFAPFVSAAHFRRAAELVATRRTQRPEPATPAVARATFFADLQEASGITFRHRGTAWYDRFAREKAVQPVEADGGVAAEDVDVDGWPDLLFLGAGGISFWRNRGDGTFEDRTASSGLAVPGEARMALVVDLDNDGRREVFATYARDPVRLFRRRDDGSYEDVSAASGLQRPGDIAQPACAFDADGDGLLDLYVGNNGDYWNGVSPSSARGARNGQKNRLFRNVGGLRFEDVTEQSGAGDPGWCLAVASADADGDGDADLFLANDFGPDELLLNRGGLTFESAGARARFDDDGHGMNVAFADLNGDDRPDVFVSNIYTIDHGKKAPREWNRLLLSSGEGAAAYRPAQEELFRAQDTGWSWAALFFDAENDGDDDLYCVNGLTGYVIYPYTRDVPGNPSLTYVTPYDREPNCFWLNEGGRFVDASTESGATLCDVNSRGLALLDFDLDGDLDLAVSTYHARPRLLRNDLAGRGGNHWLVVRLIGDPARGSSRDAVGARVLATGPGLRVWRLVTAGEGFLGSSTLDVEIGLGAATEADLEIRWPSGEVQKLCRVAADGHLTVRQGEPEPVRRKLRGGR